MNAVSLRLSSGVLEDVVGTILAFAPAQIWIRDPKDGKPVRVQ